MNAQARILPGVLAEIANVAGEEAALAIADARGGTQVYIPPEPDADHWLSRLVGHDQALRIAEALTCGVGGRRLEMPQGPGGRIASAQARVDAMIRAGRSERDIAMATGYTTRSVRRRAAKMRDREDDAQLPLDLT